MMRKHEVMRQGEIMKVPEGAPKTRKAAIHHLLRHLDGIPDESFESIDEAVKQHGSQDMVGDYQRWFQLISKR